MKNWIFRQAPETSPPRGLAERLSVTPTLLSLLWGRGFTSEESIDAFLSPSLGRLIPPAQWPGVSEAAQLFADRLLQGKKAAVWGDYDVDGITATALVMDVLECHGIHIQPYLPDRRTEGYGLNIAAVEKMAAEGIDTLLTVDCGISDVKPVSRARELGMTVIVSDHHLPPEVLPPANIFCNPRLVPAETCPCPHLAGVGVAFFLMAAVNTILFKARGTRCVMDSVLDLAALGTLADVMPLSGQNRILVKGGLRAMTQTKRHGIAALKSVCKFSESAPLTAGQAVFRLAPRINAAGRMGQADLALKLLRARDRDEARRLAEQLDELNTERRTEEDRIGKEAHEETLRQVDEGRMGIVLYGSDWHSGIIGIVASRIVEEFYRPTIILCDDKDAVKGSGRSIEEFDLHAGLCSISSHMLGFGGHRQAAGVRISHAAIQPFAKAFDEAVRAKLGNTPPNPSLILESELNFEQAASPIFLKELALLQPYGCGNPEPVFASPALTVKARLPLGRSGDHVQLKLWDETTGCTLSAKAWRQARSFPDSICGKRIRIAYTPQIDTYNGIASVDVNIKDWKAID